ncbi:MAG: YceD family protein [Lachnospiraceae bacterium]
MLINLSQLFTSEGKEKRYTPDIEMDQFQAPDGVYEVVDKEPVVLRIRHLGNRSLLVEGKAVLSLLIPCSRCLQPVKIDFSLDIDCSLDMNQTDEERIEELDEQPYVSGYNLDVDQLVCNELLLNLPMKVLCNDNCKGICNRCGANLNHENCACEQSSPDPRMSVIQDIFKQFKEV